MKRELALRLLQEIVPGLEDEAVAADLFRELRFLADYKYNKYEMYYPGRLFLENLALWLQQFEEGERQAALDFVRKQLIFVSRLEFQQLAGILYHDVIRRCQLNTSASIDGYPPHRIRAIRESKTFGQVEECSLYVGMSDGARIDYIRRHNLAISNEQVLPYYDVSEVKISQVMKDLRKLTGNPEATFHCLFLIDDFCGSGRTLLREVITAQLADGATPPTIPTKWQSRLRFDDVTNELEWRYDGEIDEADQSTLITMSGDEKFRVAVLELASKAKSGETTLKGALTKVAASAVHNVLHENAEVFFCPLLATEHAVNRLQPLVSRLPGRFAGLRILPGAVIDSTNEITTPTTPIGALCDKYYSDEFGDQHTGDVKYGFDNCGLPLTLHHNTPNNSIYLLWARRKQSFHPLFVRYERHGRERD